MFFIYLIFPCFISKVLSAAVVPYQKESLNWNDVKLSNPHYMKFIEYANTSLCFDAPDLIHFKDFYVAVTTGLSSSNILKYSDLENYQEAIKNHANIEDFCKSLHKNLPDNLTFSNLTIGDECKNSCFCRIPFVDKKIPDTGCILLDYIYNKTTSIENNKKDESNNIDLVNNLVTVPDEVIQPVDEIINDSNKGSDIQLIPKNLPKKSDIDQKIDKAVSEQREGLPKIITKIETPKIETTKIETDIENKKSTSDTSKKLPITQEDVSNKVPLINEDNLNSNANSKIPNLTEQEKIFKNDEFSPASGVEDEEIYNDENNSERAYKQYPTNTNEKQVISTKYTVQEDTGSNFFTYLFLGMFLTIVFYVIYHNKTKILALILEGRRSKSGRGRRKHTASYSKLDSNLEEAISSPYSGRSSQIIY